MNMNIKNLNDTSHLNKKENEFNELAPDKILVYEYQLKKNRHDINRSFINHIKKLNEYQVQPQRIAVAKAEHSG